MMGGGNFTITGGGNCATGTNNVTLWGPNGSSTFWDRITLTQYACADAGSNFGAAFPFANMFHGIYVDGFGGTSCQASGLNVIITDSFCGESKNSNLYVMSGTILRTHNLYMGSTQSTIGVWVGKTGAAEWDSVQDQNYGGVAGGGAQIYVDAGGVLKLNQWYENGGGSTYDIELTATGKAYIANSKFTAVTHNWGTGGVTLTTGGFFDLGGNIFSSNNNESTTLPTCAMTTGGGTGPACATANTFANSAFDVVMTPGTTPGNSGTTTVTYAGTNQNNSGLLPTLTCQLKNGTGTWNARATVILSTDSATAPILTWDNNGVALTAASTYIFKCTSKAN